MIETEGITREFGSILALKDISFKVEKGEVVGLLGPNGAGKTTTMRILACLIPPTSGVARVAGLDVLEHSLEVKRKIGYFLEKVPLYPDMRVLPFLRFVGEVKGVRGRQLRKAISETMDLCGLGHVSNRIINNLSKGYKQRIGLAQALINQPEVLILDEPTIGLDPEHVLEIRKLVKGLSGERTVILSSHILPEVSMICSKVIIIDNGRIVAADTPENLSALLQKRLSIDVQIEGPLETILEQFKGISGVSRVEAMESVSDGVHRYRIEYERDTDIYYEISSLAIKHRWTLREMKQAKMGLEEIFVKLVTKDRTG